jgi:crotonobetainyl-CoA:carnitine CoA-transferase CaiB-like acyl-CoA transferase
MGLSPYYRLYRCGDDSWLFLAAVTPQERDRLSELVGGFDPSAPAAEVAGLLEVRFGDKSATEWFVALDEAAIPAEVVNEEFCRTIFDDPQARLLGLVSETWSSGVGRFEDPGILVNVFPTTPVIQRGPCMCGEHTRQILLEYGFSDQEVDTFVTEGAILDAPSSR